ncbi:MAG: hypothetical protein NC826_03390 [Candidatus Omnitrophica bacterium]|nr:hypothetical protein [Candidatus Omnitrophota bacterium]
MEQYKDFSATHLFCDRCGMSMPVKERLLLILPDGYLYEYICMGCGNSVGDKKVSLNPEDRILF